MFLFWGFWSPDRRVPGLGFGFAPLATWSSSVPSDLEFGREMTGSGWDTGRANKISAPSSCPLAESFLFWNLRKFSQTRNSLFQMQKNNTEAVGAKILSVICRFKSNQIINPKIVLNRDLLALRWTVNRRIFARLLGYILQAQGSWQALLSHQRVEPPTQCWTALKVGNLGIVHKCLKCRELPPLVWCKRQTWSLRSSSLNYLAFTGSHHYNDNGAHYKRSQLRQSVNLRFVSKWSAQNLSSCFRQVNVSHTSNHCEVGECGLNAPHVFGKDQLLQVPLNDCRGCSQKLENILRELSGLESSFWLKR